MRRYGRASTSWATFREPVRAIESQIRASPSPRVPVIVLAPLRQVPSPLLRSGGEPEFLAAQVAASSTAQVAAQVAVVLLVLHLFRPCRCRCCYFSTLRRRRSKDTPERRPQRKRAFLEVRCQIWSIFGQCMQARVEKRRSNLSPRPARSSMTQDSHTKRCSRGGDTSAAISFGDLLRVALLTEPTGCLIKR